MHSKVGIAYLSRPSIAILRCRNALKLLLSFFYFARLGLLYSHSACEVSNLHQASFCNAKVIDGETIRSQCM